MTTEQQKNVRLSSATTPHCLILDVDLLPGVSAPWAHVPCAGDGAAQSFLKSLLMAEAGLDKGTPWAPSIGHGSHYWELAGEDVVMYNCFERTSTVEATGYTIRVPVKRLAAIFAEASALVRGLAREEDAKERIPLGKQPTSTAFRPRPTDPDGYTVVIDTDPDDEGGPHHWTLRFERRRGAALFRFDVLYPNHHSIERWRRLADPRVRASLELGGHADIKKEDNVVSFSGDTHECGIDFLMTAGIGDVAPQLIRALDAAVAAGLPFATNE